MDASDRCVIIEPPWAGRFEEFGRPARSPIPDHAFAHLAGDPATNGGLGHRWHRTIVARCVATLLAVPAENPEAGGEGRAASGRGWSALPRWVVPATIVFWVGYLATILARHVWERLDALALLLVISVFLTLAIEPAVNRLERRGVRRGHSTGGILFGLLLVFLVFAGAIGTLVGNQVADLLQNSERYITDTVDLVNRTINTDIDPEQVIAEFNDPDGSVQRFIQSQQDEVFRLSVQAVGVLLQAFAVVLFTFYLVADGPRLRRSICSRLPRDRQLAVLSTWELAITKTGGYLYSRALLAVLSAVFHYVVFEVSGIPAPIPLALWVGFVSQFLPVVGTYIAGFLPVLIAFLDDPAKALVVVVFIVVYQQVENYLFAPRITARTMELHPAVAFGAALGGGLLLGFVGAVLALPAAAMAQALVSGWGARHEVVESPLTSVPAAPARRRWRRT